MPFIKANIVCIQIILLVPVIASGREVPLFKILWEVLYLHPLVTHLMLLCKASVSLEKKSLRDQHELKENKQVEEGKYID